MTRPSLFLACCLLTTCALPNCSCPGFTQLPQGSFTGQKLNSAGAARLSANGFSYLNANGETFMSLLAPGGVMNVTIPCSPQTTSVIGIPVLQLAIADTGQPGCADESCGRMDGTCDADDQGHPVTLTLADPRFEPAAPNLLRVRVTAAVDTGALPISSVGGTPLCGLIPPFGRAKFTVDYDSARQPPVTNELLLDLALTIDTRWDQVLKLEVAAIGNTQACGGTATEACIDPDDMEILNEGCSALNIANLGPVKTLLINQLTAQLRTQLTTRLGDTLCAACGPQGECPTSGTHTSSCQAGLCRDDSNGACVPLSLGMEGRAELDVLLSGLGVPPGAAVELAIGAGGSAEATSVGLTAGLRGGVQALTVADCVTALQRPTPPTLPLPDFDQLAPGPYDVGFSVSNQFLSELFFNAHQSGALCLQLGTSTVSLLSSELLGTLLPSLNKLTHGKNVPLLIALRPTAPPSAVIGANTIDASGALVEPLLRLDWPNLEVDLYAQLEERQVRLFTVLADVSLPLGVEADCATLTPVIGSLGNLVSNVVVGNSELLAEDATVLANLLPTLLSLAEPQLAAGLGGFAVPDLMGTLEVVGARGIAPLQGANTFGHAAFYARLPSDAGACVAQQKRATQSLVVRAERSEGAATLFVPRGRYAWRIDGGLWSTWREADGALQLEHPRLRLGGRHLVELKSASGEVQQLTLHD